MLVELISKKDVDSLNHLITNLVTTVKSYRYLFKSRYCIIYVYLLF